MLLMLVIWLPWCFLLFGQMETWGPYFGAQGGHLAICGLECGPQGGHLARCAPDSCWPFGAMCSFLVLAIWPNVVFVGAAVWVQRFSKPVFVLLMMLS